MEEKGESYLTLGFGLANEEWDAIVYSINKGKCVLLLGPGCARNQEGECLYDQFCEKIAEQIGKNVSKENDQLFSLYEDFKKIKGWAFRPIIENILNEVYNHARPHSIYYSIAKIPFRVVISTSPDKLLPDIFDENGWEYQFKIYDKQEKILITERPTIDCPLIINLFGSYEERESLILTHDDIFDFLFSIIPDRSLPDIIRNEISHKDTSFIFLGFDFESWYLKIILRLLLLHTKEKDSALAYPWQHERLKSETRVFFSNKFNLKFIESDIQLFLNELANRVNNPRVISTNLQQPVSEILSRKIVNRVRACIQKDEINDAIIQLTDYTNKYNARLRQEVDVISGNLSYLISQKRQGLLPLDQERIEFAKIRRGLSEIVEDIANYENYDGRI